jgi:hypothetical protein
VALTVSHSTAIHEAAHAVMGFLLRRPVRVISAIAGPDSRGYTESQPPRIDWMDPAVPLTKHGRRWLWDYTLIAISGALTQKERYPHTPDGAMAPDLRQVERLALRACEGDRGRAVLYATEAGARPRFYANQDRYWLLVDTLADALLGVGTPSGYQAREILKATDMATRGPRGQVGAVSG